MSKYKGFQALSHIVLILFSVMALLPFWILVTASLSDEATSVKEGFSLWPKQWSTDAYKYLLSKWSMFGRGYLITITVTVIGVLVCVVITMMLGYMLSRPGIPGRRVVQFLVIFTMLFNGGLVATYITYSTVFHIKNTLFALIVPSLLTNAFYITMVRNFFSSNIPNEVLEAARVDGCTEYGIFFRIVMPLSKPMAATLALMAGVAYWNDWQNGLYYLDDQNMYGIQNILNAINESNKYLMQAGGGGGTMPTETARMAAAVIGIFPVLIAYFFFQDYFVKGLTMGAVKG